MITTQTRPPKNLAIMLDSETTGLNANKNHVLEIALRVVNHDSGEILCSYDSVIRLSKDEWAQAHPKALEVNGFTWQDVTEKGKDRKEVAFEITQLFKKHEISRRNAYFLCQNPSFDCPFFAQILSEDEQGANQFPYHWLDLASMVFALERKEIVKGERENISYYLSKDSIAERYGIPPEEKPHKAMNGVDHLLKIYEKVIGFRNKS
ncbi:MAG: Ribonuclease T [Chlamydiae bacterium]|nr:Ribonuclease T [Chlamydiota bacterium]